MRFVGEEEEEALFGRIWMFVRRGIGKREKCKGLETWRWRC
jgi:hypothetical protein